jgi:hypothetical protein
MKNIKLLFYDLRQHRGLWANRSKRDTNLHMSIPYGILNKIAIVSVPNVERSNLIIKAA